MLHTLRPGGCNPTTIPAYIGSTIATGDFSTNQELTLNSLVLPQFFCNRVITNVAVKLFTAPCRYDIILGRDVLTRLGMKFDMDNLTMTWDGERIATVCECLTLPLLPLEWTYSWAPWTKHLRL